MPEYPDVTVYIEALERYIAGGVLRKIRIAHPFLLRTFDPSPSDAAGRTIVGCRRIGKRIIIELSDDIFLALHLMIAGRLHWKEPGARIPRRVGLAAIDIEPATRLSAAPNAHPSSHAAGPRSGSLLLTEAGTKKRASLHIVRGEDSLALFDRGGLEVTTASLAELRSALRRENHTIKRTLTDPRLISGIGNAYSDEILHRARLSPFKQTNALGDEETERLYAACVEVLSEWVERLRRETADGFPEKVTAFRKEMAVHGRYGKPCPVCGTEVQRIVYAENECNYCPTCQTGGKLLADRSLSRLLKSDWPATLTELEELKEHMRRSEDT